MTEEEKGERTGKSRRDRPAAEESEARRKQRFAADIARAEFGRHYWDHKKQQAMEEEERKARRRPVPKPPKP
ncbi:MAG: hypothetical protein AAGF59_13805 [Pseudomonadota bacterium]